MKQEGIAPMEEDKNEPVQEETVKEEQLLKSSDEQKAETENRQKGKGKAKGKGKRKTKGKAKGKTKGKGKEKQPDKETEEPEAEMQAETAVEIQEQEVNRDNSKKKPRTMKIPDFVPDYETKVEWYSRMLEFLGAKQSPEMDSLGIFEVVDPAWRSAEV